MGIRFSTASIRLNLLELPQIVNKQVGFSEYQNGITSCNKNTFHTHGDIFYWNSYFNMDRT